MIKLTGIITGIAITSGSLYLLVPDQSRQIVDGLKQSGMNAADAIFKRTQPDLQMVEANHKEKDSHMFLDRQDQEPEAATPEQFANNQVDKLINSLEDRFGNFVPVAAKEITAPEETAPVAGDALHNGPAATTEQQVFFWRPFDNKSQAEAFVHFLQKKTGFTYTVVVNHTGLQTKYLAAVRIAGDQSKEDFLKAIESITGPSALQPSAG